jgi:hypothetical protein
LDILIHYPQNKNGEDDITHFVELHYTSLFIIILKELKNREGWWGWWGFEGFEQNKIKMKKVGEGRLKLRGS